MKEVILVDFNDREIGAMEKMEAHEKKRLHRAFSVFLVQDGKMLLQKRASDKYHCGGLWTNTCCSHPRPGEETKSAAVRRLKEELEITVEPEELEEVHSILYRYPFDNGLTEFEYDHLFVGEYHGTWVENPEEVDAVKWVEIEWLKKDIVEHAEKYTPWFIIALKEVLKKMY